MEKGEQIVLVDEQGEEVIFCAQEMTTLGGVDYILITETEDFSGDAYILKETGEEGDELILEMVDDDDELAALADIFEELLAEEDEEEE